MSITTLFDGLDPISLDFKIINIQTWLEEMSCHGDADSWQREQRAQEWTQSHGGEYCEGNRQFTRGFLAR